MIGPHKVSAIQMVSGTELDTNLERAASALTQARDAGARLAVLPENFAFLGRRDADRIAIAEDDGEGPIQTWLSDQARGLGLNIVGGTIPLRADGETVSASCLVYDDAGMRIARYDKIHLFDVDIPDRDERYRESASTVAGGDVVVVDTSIGRLGLAVCYDLRFPELFRALSDRGVEVVALPSAFTAATGEAHWEILVRARAVENLCYLVAAAQGGTHTSGRETWGDSMLVDPWGNVIDRLAAGPGVVTGDVDLARLRAVRGHFPALSHRRLN